MKSKHTESSALSSLSRKRDIHVNTHTKRITLNNSVRASNDVGNGSLGRIDYLVHYCGYNLSITKSEEAFNNAKKGNTEPRKLKQEIDLLALHLV